MSLSECRVEAGDDKLEDWAVTGERWWHVAAELSEIMQTLVKLNHARWLCCKQYMVFKDWMVICSGYIQHRIMTLQKVNKGL